MAQIDFVVLSWLYLWFLYMVATYFFLYDMVRLHCSNVSYVIVSLELVWTSANANWYICVARVQVVQSSRNKVPLSLFWCNVYLLETYSYRVKSVMCKNLFKSWWYKTECPLKQLWKELKCPHFLQHLRVKRCRDSRLFHRMIKLTFILQCPGEQKRWETLLLFWRMEKKVIRKKYH